jgi:hypothetical protein
MVARALAAQGIACSRTFNFRPTHGPACPAACRLTAGPDCDCRLAVLMAYPQAGPPLSITAVGVGGRTRFRIDPNANQLARQHLDARVRAALSVPTAPPSRPDTPPTRSTE